MPYVTVNDRGPRPSRLLVLSAQEGDAPVVVFGRQHAASHVRDPGGGLRLAGLKGDGAGEPVPFRPKDLDLCGKRRGCWGLWAS